VAPALAGCSRLGLVIRFQARSRRARSSTRNARRQRLYPHYITIGDRMNMHILTTGHLMLDVASGKKTWAPVT
jgi:hypothetical protein